QTVLYGRGHCPCRLHGVREDLRGTVQDPPEQHPGGRGRHHFTSAYNIYSFLLTLSTAGLPLALSKLISEADATGRRNQMRRCFNTAMALFVAVGAVGTAAMLFFTEELAAWMNNSMAYWPIK